MKTYNLWRRYRHAPMRRWACAVRESESDQGYEVVDFDGDVADPAFMHALQIGMDQPAQIMRSEPIPGHPDGHLDVSETVYPGDEGHFHSAIRNLAEAHIGPPRPTGGV